MLKNKVLELMNSIMQQIYMVPTFRYAILQSDDHKEMNTNIFDDFMFIWIDWALKACFLMGGGFSYVPQCLL